jgi:hypothetical protein
MLMLFHAAWHIVDMIRSEHLAFLSSINSRKQRAEAAYVFCGVWLARAVIVVEARAEELQRRGPD